MAYLKIKLRSDLCAGNGESVGNSVDTDVCMDTAGLPYIPSRRLKGCLKQSAYDLQKMGYKNAAQVNIDRLFGDAFGQEGCLFIQDAVIGGAGSIREFLKKEIPHKNAIPAVVKKAAHPSNVERLFTTVRGQTRLENGIKVDNSLRFTRVIGHYDPFELGTEKEMSFYAPICVDTDDKELLGLFEACCKATRHIGTGRNRGLGNVEISIYKKRPEDGKHTGTMKANVMKTNAMKANAMKTNAMKMGVVKTNVMGEECAVKNSKDITISYKIALDSPVTLPGCDELNTSIPARSVIGCLAGNYLKHGSAGDEEFQNLFLNGMVRWSALTPVVKGVISDPVPMMLEKLKNDNGRMINHLTEDSDKWKKLKPKTMDGSFAAVISQNGEETDSQIGECTDRQSSEGTASQIGEDADRQSNGKTAHKGPVYAIVEPEIHTVYHNSMNGTVQDLSQSSGRTLYMQDSIDAGMIYGGTVVCPADMKSAVIQSLKESTLRFGRSRSAQYAACSLYGEPEVTENFEEKIDTEAGEIVYVILKSDLAYQQNGLYITDNQKIRKALAEKLGLTDEMPENHLDYCRYHTIGGYQSTWQLQKPQIPVVRAGSIYCFKANGKSLPTKISIGGFGQEGFGVCSIMTRKQLLDVTDIKKESIDRIEPEPDQERMEKIYTRILVSAGMETMKSYALKFKVLQKELPIARLRLMLSEAKDYQDLIDLIGTIKESDVSSEKDVSRQADSRNFLQKLYEEEVSSDSNALKSQKQAVHPASDKIRNKISLKKMLQDEEGLWEEMEQHPEAKEILLDHWKIPLEIILHAQHYQKER